MTSTQIAELAIPETLANALNAVLYPASVVTINDASLCLVCLNGIKRLAIIAHGQHRLLNIMEGDPALSLEDTGQYYRLCPLSPRNAATLRNLLPWLKPRLLGLHASAGCGDRLGLATPAHARAVAKTWGNGKAGMMPIFAQQSIRENSRTRRTPQEVIDDAMWGVFEAGWRRGYGADADHCKTSADIDVTVAAGYTFFTVDPGEHVRSDAAALDEEARQAELRALPWDALDDSVETLQERYPDAEPVALMVAAVKYGRAIAHSASMYGYLVQKVGAGNFELEVSVDETDSATTHLEHRYIATELKRLGVVWVSLAPRFVGRFEKGVDYQGEAGGLTEDDLNAFRADLAGHAAIARALGPYKLSLHSGSDKFSIYAIAAELTGGLVHLKTAGTSYLEALRAVAGVRPALFREIYAFAIERYPEDRRTYHVSAEVARMPEPDSLSDTDLPAVLDQFDARQALHVTFGSVLNATEHNGAPRFKNDLLAALSDHEEEHYETITSHFERHLAPFFANIPN